MSRGKRTNEFAAEIRERGLSYDDVHALWLAASWHLVHEAKHVRPETARGRMCGSLRRMPMDYCMHGYDTTDVGHDCLSEDGESVGGLSRAVREWDSSKVDWGPIEES